MPKKRGHGDGALYYIKARKLWRGVVDLEPGPDGKRIQKYVHAKSQSDCRTKLLNLQAEIDEYGQPLDNTVTLGTWAWHWLNVYKKPDVDPRTYSVYASAINKWIEPTIGHIKVSALKASDVKAVHIAMQSAGRRASSTRSVHDILGLMLEQARRSELTRKNVVKDVDPPGKNRAKDINVRDSIPPDDAFAILEAAANHDLGSMWWFKMLGGPRQTEILGATIDSLDLGEGIYQVNWSLEQVPKEHGCGDVRDKAYPCGKVRGYACPESRWRIPQDFEMRHLQAHWCLTRPKSQTGRVIPLAQPVQALISNYLERHKDDPNPHGLIWRKADGSPITPREDAQAWRDLLFAGGVITEAELGPGASAITGHWARHTVITLLAEMGVDFQLIGEIVGHSSREVTAVYRHAQRSEKVKAMQGLSDRVLNGRLAIEG